MATLSVDQHDKLMRARQTLQPGLFKRGLQLLGRSSILPVRVPVFEDHLEYKTFLSGDRFSRQNVRDVIACTSGPRIQRIAFAPEELAVADQLSQVVRSGASIGVFEKSELMPKMVRGFSCTAATALTAMSFTHASTRHSNVSTRTGLVMTTHIHSVCASFWLS